MEDAGRARSRERHAAVRPDDGLPVRDDPAGAATGEPVKMRLEKCHVRYSTWLRGNYAISILGELIRHLRSPTCTNNQYNLSSALISQILEDGHYHRHPQSAPLRSLTFQFFIKVFTFQSAMID